MPYRDGARRRLRSRAVLGPIAAPPPASAGPVRAVCGTIVDASPHVLVLDTGDAEPARVPMTPGTSIWHGGRAGLPALVPGRRALVRRAADSAVAERVWVDIVRVTGTIDSCTQKVVHVDGGPHRGRAEVVIPPNTLGRILVRHPRMEPGYLFDVICVQRPGGLHAVRPGTSQPSHPADRVASLPPAAAPAPEESGAPAGTATWFGDLTPPSWDPPEAESPPGAAASGPARTRWRPGGDLRGAAYPAVDPEGHAGGCVDAPEGCAPLPYLSCGSALVVHNQCADRTALVPIVECGCVAARYCDRCVECGTSPRGRIVELTPLSFVELGGDLDAACFNVTLDLAATAAAHPSMEGRP
ncbi:hypothetical protein DFJ69_2923 [Thermomonospora umbrina]|uniref:Uncharacterized protein n=2 Tax=Thermomonospora umbrina TaxID=111806 RepID=A0A3D9T0V0_9ACTN|nr:hypothetical protein DFJ69_2923 [Thermomonospora umbrina]